MATWYTSGSDVWTYRYKATVDHTKVGADVADFPTPLKITTTEWPELANAQPGGGDIVFTNTNGTTKIPHRIVSFDGTTLIAWVKCTHDVDADADFYIYCGCSTCIGQEDAANVFPSEYVFALGMGDGTIQTAADATSLWLNKRRAIYFSGTYQRIYLGYLKWQTGCDIYITYFDLDTLRWATPVKVDDAEADSAHNAPTLAIDADGYIYVFYGGYSGATGKLFMKKSTNVEDISAWGSVVNAVNSDMNCAYPQCLILSDGKFALFYRGTRADGGTTYYGIYRILSSDSGATWGNSQTVVEGVADLDTQYYSVCIGASDRVHLAYHYRDYSAGNLNHDLYYAYTDNATAATPAWKEADGGAITLPMAEGAGYLVFNSDASWDTGYVGAIVADSTNRPFILYKVTDSVATDKLLCFDYSGGAWNETTVLESDAIGTPYDADTSICDGSLYIFGTTLYAAFTVAVSAKDEVQEYSTPISAISWAKARDITTGSSTHNSMPYYPLNALPSFRLVWFLGADGYDRAADIRYFGSVAAQARTTSTSCVDDYGTLAHNGTKQAAAHPAVTTSGVVGSAQDFDGTADYISMGDDAHFSFGDGSTDSPFTIALWVKFDTDKVASRSLIGIYTTAAGGGPADLREWLLYVSSGSKIYFDAWDNSTGAFRGRHYNTALANDNAWHHFVGTYSGNEACSGFKIYRDGVQIDDTDDTSGTYTAMENVARALLIGSHNEANFFAGIGDEYRLLNAEKASTWVTTLYNSQAKPLVGEAGCFWKAGGASQLESGVVAISAAANLADVATLVRLGVVNANAAASLSAVCELTLGGKVNANVAASLVVLGSLIADGKVDANAAAALLILQALVKLGAVDIQAVVSVDPAGAVFKVAAVDVQAAASLSALASTIADGVVDISAVTDLVVAGILLADGAVDVGAAAGLVAAANLIVDGTAGVTASAFLGIVPDGMVKAAACAIAALAALVAGANLTTDGKADIAAVADLIAAGSLTADGVVDVDAVASIVAAASLIADGVVDIDASASLSIVPDTMVKVGVCAVAIAASMQAVAGLIRGGNTAISAAASIEAQAALLASAQDLITAAAEVVAAGNLLADGKVSIEHVTAVLVSLGSPIRRASAGINVVASQVAVGTMTLDGVVDAQAVAELAAAASLLADAVAAITASAEIIPRGGLLFTLASAISVAVSVAALGMIVRGGVVAITATTSLQIVAIKYIVQLIGYSGSLAAGDILEIDTDRMTVKKNGTDVRYDMTGVFWKLAPGANVVEYSDAAVSRTVDMDVDHEPRWS